MFRFIVVFTGIVALAACEGAAGQEGPQGATGATGAMGAPGTMGEPGQIGPMGETGVDGVNCWDLDGDHQCSPTEDVDVSGSCEAADCAGPAGETGTAGPRGPAGFAVAYDDSGAIFPSKAADGDDGGGWDLLGTLNLPAGTYMINAQAWITSSVTLDEQCTFQTADLVVNERYLNSFIPAPTATRQTLTFMHTLTLPAAKTVQFKCSLTHTSGANPSYIRRVFQAIRIDSLNPAP